MDLISLRKYAEKNGIPIIKPETEKLLKILIGMKRPLKILEIGTAIGYSAAVMLGGGNNESKIYSIEIEESRYNAAKQNLKDFGFFDRSALYLGDATEILQNVTGSYDFIFVDGPKGQYIHFLPFLLNVLSIGGVLVCDNVLYRGLVDKTVKMRRNNITMVTNLRQFLDSINNDGNLITTVLNIGDGVSVSYKK